MSDLIDRQELLKHKGNCYDEEGHLLYAVGTGTILLMPTVDAVEVVRCKDCKFFDHSDFGKGEEYWCKHFVSTDDYAHCHKVTEDDFCAWGERRKNETDS